MLMKFFCIVLLVVVLFDWSVMVGSAQSQSLSGIAYYVRLSDVVPVTGQIVSLRDGVHALVSEEYDSHMVGVVNMEPSVSLDLVGGVDGVPMISSGYTKVLVNGAGGGIEIGDWVTSSAVPGMAMKARVDGYVLGQALESFSGDKAEDQGLIQVAVNIHVSDVVVGGSGVRIQDEARESLFDLLGVFKNASSVPAPQAFRFILAGLISLFALIFGFFTFGRVAQKGVEAIGRNPLARKTILWGLVFNVLVSLVIILSGVVVAFFVIRL